jgi:hypothetical protein
MCVQWLSIGVLVLNKHSIELFLLFCLNNGLEAFIGLMLINRKMCLFLVTFSQKVA